MRKHAFVWRAITAALLTIGFYLLAISIAAALLAGVAIEIVYAHEIFIKATLLAIFRALAILWSILPRIDRFLPPGPRLEPASQPELFSVLSDIATATEQEMPWEVFLVGDPNAFVTRRGGLMGIGSRRVMGIGLPLLQKLTIPQFRAVIAHEFGHYHGGDTALGPWIYRTREAINRTLSILAGKLSGLHKPFLWYGRLFMRVTQSISRAQESAADLLAARVGGARNAIDALLAVQRSAAVFDVYWDTEVIPVLSHGFRPPIAAGLTHFMDQEQIATQLREAIEKDLKEGKSDPFDSHPPLRERIASLEPLADDAASEDAPLASTLIRGMDAVELNLLRFFAQDPLAIAALPKIDWAETGTRAFLPEWQVNVTKNADVLRTILPILLPSLLNDFPQFVARLNLKDVPSDHHESAANAILGSGLAVRLHREGWVCDASPGRPITMSKGDAIIAPFTIMPRLATGELTDEDWITDCANLGFGALPLA